jgi:cellulose synthase/poly-beta-1,6-N-acetylglucosamine synthase-like glycosyltransferase
MILLQAIFWFSLFLIFHTYILFPAILQLLSAGNKPKKTVHERVDENSTGQFPFLSVLIAAFNEEEVIEAKIRSVLDSDYPAGRVEILAGSDHSTDRTNEILLELEKQNQMVKVVFFKERTGKPEVINHLARIAKGEILVITDANVMLNRATLRNLAESFRNKEVALVDTRMVNTSLNKDGISHQEKFYIGREVRLKNQESILWGSMMGPFGGCYAVRKQNFTPVPGHFLVDDFYVNMSVLMQGFKCVSNLNANVYEDVSNDLKEEFRRKKRISAGNFQNLQKFGSLLFSRRPGVAFCFLSHKVIRWIVPLLVLITLGTSLYLGIYKMQHAAGSLPPGKNLYLMFALAQLIFIFIPVIDQILRKLGIHVLPLRFVSHFVLMNLALLAGFLRYLGGIKSNVWQPTRRNQSKVESH